MTKSIKEEKMNKEIDALINESIQNEVFPGACFGIVYRKANKKMHKEVKSYGFKALYPQSEKNDLSTLYDMASCSKVISTVTSILILMEKGMLRLYEPVANIIPEFNLKEVTIWDLLTHTSGLMPVLPGGVKMKRNEILTGIFSITPTYEKNSKIVYSDLNFILLGLIVEKVSNMSLDEFAKKHIFTPLKMKNTCYNPKSESQCAPTENRGDRIDRGYVHDEVAHNLGGVAGHAGLFATIEDITHFMTMILNDGVYNKKRILSKASINLIFTPQVEDVDKISLTNEKRSLGWIVKGAHPVSGMLASKDTIMHTGFTGTSVVIDRSNQIAYALLSNRVHPTRKNAKIIAFRPKLGNYILSHLKEITGRNNEDLL